MNKHLAAKDLKASATLKQMSTIQKDIHAIRNKFVGPPKEEKEEGGDMGWSDLVIMIMLFGGFVGVLYSIIKLMDWDLEKREKKRDQKYEEERKEREKLYEEDRKKQMRQREQHEMRLKAIRDGTFKGY